MTIEGVPDLDPRWPQLLAAARAWKAGLIRGTSTTTQNLASRLVEAIDAFDSPCDHPRAQRVFHINGLERCGKCGVPIEAERPTADGRAVQDTEPL